MTKARRRVAIGIYAIVTLVYLLTASSATLRAHTPYDHFALQADALIHGRLDLGGPPPAYTGNNDFAVFGGKTYVSFPPFPALLLVPFVKLAGSPEALPDGLIFLLLAGIGPSFLFLALEKLSELGRNKRTLRENAGLALLFAFGTVYWFSAIQGTVWFAAHVVGVALACMYLFFAIGGDRPALAGLCLALGFATRTALGFAFPIFFYEIYRASKAALPEGAIEEDATPLDVIGASAGELTKRFALFATPCALVLGCVFWMNRARFGDPFEFGHRYLAVVWRARIDKWGLESFHYLGRNLAVVLTSLPFFKVQGAPFQINAHGLALWITSPFYAWAIWPKKTGPTFWALALTAGLVALPALLYQNSGWIQFGYRFSNDFAPFLFAMIACSGRKLGAWFKALAVFAVVVNAFGAVSFQRAGWERYYFVDGSQKILHQPD